MHPTAAEPLNDSKTSRARVQFRMRWCRWPDSNRHNFRYQLLGLACLPIPPHRHSLEPPRGVEPRTFSLQMSCSTG